jgi:tripartite-type tricarboxylate transporter receptor subunit TctC
MRLLGALLPLTMTTLAALAAVLCAPPAALAQEWPARPVKFVVPVPTGGGLDPFVRALAYKLADSLKQKFIVENKPGASGSVGTAFVAKSAPDGYTFIFVYDTHTLNPTLIRDLPFDTVKDLAPVMLIGTAPQLLAAYPGRPYKSFADVATESKARPGSINVGSTGNGSLGHLALLQLARDGVQLTHIPYKGGGPLLQDLVGGQIDLGISGLPNMLPHVKSGLIRPLAVTATARSKALPEVPTLKEAGMPNVTAYTWWGILAPEGTPKTIIAKFHEAVAQAMNTPDIRRMFSDTLAMDVVASSPEALQQFVAKEMATWSKVVRENNIKAE